VNAVNPQDGLMLVKARSGVKVLLLFAAPAGFPPIRLVQQGQPLAGVGYNHSLRDAPV